MHTSLCRCMCWSTTEEDSGAITMKFRKTFFEWYKDPEQGSSCVGGVGRIGMTSWRKCHFLLRTLGSAGWVG